MTSLQDTVMSYNKRRRSLPKTQSSQRNGTCRDTKPETNLVHIRLNRKHVRERKPETNRVVIYT